MIVIDGARRHGRGLDGDGRHRGRSKYVCGQHSSIILQWACVLHF